MDSTPPNTTGLAIPDAATHNLADIITRGTPPDGPAYRAAVELIAAPVVAAELRRLARAHRQQSWVGTGQLYARADDLAGGAQ